MRSNLRQVTRILSNGALEDPVRLDWAALTEEDLVILTAEMRRRGCADSTIKTRLYGVKGVLRHARRRPDCLAWHVFKTSNPHLARKCQRRTLTEAEVQRLAECCSDGTYAGARDATLLALLLMGGLRRSEVSALQYGDCQTCQGGFVLTIPGRRAASQTVKITGSAAVALGDWLHGCREKQGPLLRAVNKGRRRRSRNSLSVQAIGVALARLSERAGVERVTPRDCRYTYLQHTILDIPYGRPSIDVTPRPGMP